MKDFEVIDEILGCKVIIDSDLDSITIQQAQHTKEIIAKFLPADDNILSSVPADRNLHLVRSQCAQSEEEIQSFF